MDESILFPNDHAYAIEGVLKTIRLIEAHPAILDGDIVSELVGLGYSAIDARKLVLFVPSALAWATMHLMGVRQFPGCFVALNHYGQKVELPLKRQHFFTAALDLSTAVLAKGWSQELPRSTMELVVGRSAEMDAFSKALAAGEDPRAIQLTPLVVFDFRVEEAEVSLPGS